MRGWGLLGTHLDLQNCLILGYSARMAPFPGLLQWTDGLTSAAKVSVCEAGACFPSLAFPQIHSTQLLQVDVCSAEAAEGQGGAGIQAGAQCPGMAEPGSVLPCLHP